MTESRYAETHEALLSDVLPTDGSSAILVDPTPELLGAVATELDGTAADLRVLARESVLKRVRDDFLLASRVADLVESGTVDLRATTDPLHNTLLASDSSVVAFVTGGDRVGALAETDETLTADTVAHYGDRFEQAESFDLRTPGRTRFSETLAEELGETVRDDIDAVLNAVDAVTGEAGHLDAVQIVLLLAGRHEQLLYDTSGWGEDVGLASKATFSRTKTDLEEAGLLTTEKVPLDVGRPRMRLLLDDEELADADPEEFAGIALERLAE